MSTYVEGGFKTYTAAEDIPAFTIVKTNAAGQLENATAATDLSLGTIHAAVKAGRQIDVRLRNAAGTAQVKCAGVVAKDAPLTSDANGLAVAAAVAGNQVVGYALEAGVANKVIEFLPTTAKF